jgi:hypothetical protein
MMTVYTDILIYVMTDVTVISADCAMTGDCMLTLGLLLWVACIPTVDPFRTDKPLWLDGHLPLVDNGLRFIFRLPFNVGVD